MVEEYTNEEKRKLLERLPEELKEALFSEKTTDAIFNVCDRNEVEEDKIPKISEYVGQVLLGILPFEDFERALKEKVGLNVQKAKKVSSEMFHFVFYPVKEALASLYRSEIPISEKPGTETLPETKPPIKPPPGEKIKEEEKIEETKKEDVYREPIE